ncbi:hypothetical protein D3C78_1147110 [compost metagenome]
MLDDGTTRYGAVGIGIQGHARLLEVLGQHLEGLAGPDHRRGGFPQGGALLGVQFPFPLHAVQVVGEVRRRLALSVEREVLVIGVGLRVVEIRIVLPVLGGGCLMLVRLLVAVVHAVVEQPVGDQPLLVALDHLAAQGAETAALAGEVPVLGLDGRAELGQVAAEHQTEQIPAGAE